MSSSPFLSIIVPVFNTIQFVSQCIDSILSQSFSHYELLLIDDGSTDGSGRVCDEYASKDSRIKVIHKENAGVSSARNVGLDKAEGEWVCFIDSDDELLSGGLKTMVDCVSDDLDLVLAGYERYDESGSVFYRVDDRVVLKLSKKKSLSFLYEPHAQYYCYLGYVWGRLFRNRIIQDHHLHFDPKLKIKEDTLFIAQYILSSNGITCFTTTPVYRYNERGNSAMGELRGGFNTRLIDGFYALVKMEHEIVKQFPFYSEIVFIAKEGVWIRYNQILCRMEKYGVRDDILRDTMKSVVDRELDLSFFVRKKIRTLKRKWLH